MAQREQVVQSKTLTRSDVLVILREHKQDLAKKYGVTRLGVFGSVARAENSAVSDVDVVVEMPPNYAQMVRMKEELETILHAPVDLIRYQPYLSDFFKQRLEQEAIYV
jgi:predicted nucleotidyltransferase